MPSGSKKRKAAKKKKEYQPSHSSASTHSHENDDVNHRGDKESDGGEISSPASQGHHGHQNLLREGEEEENEGKENISNTPCAEGFKIEVGGEPNIVIEEESVVPVEREFKIEDGSDVKNGRFEHDETARKSYDGCSSGSSSSSSSSSSDDESMGIKSSQDAVDISPVVDSMKVADSLSGRPAEATHSTMIAEAGDLVVENIPPVDLEKISLVGEKVEAYSSSPADNSAAPYIVESVYKENGEKRLSSLEDIVGISAAFIDVASDRREGEAIVQSVEDIATIPDQKECVALENDDRLTVSYNAPIAAADNGADCEKDSGVTEPLLSPAPRPVQTTSWKSCCGLFELFTGSGR